MKKAAAATQSSSSSSHAQLPERGEHPHCDLEHAILIIIGWGGASGRVWRVFLLSADHRDAAPPPPPSLSPSLSPQAQRRAFSSGARQAAKPLQVRLFYFGDGGSSIRRSSTTCCWTAIDVCCRACDSARAGPSSAPFGEPQPSGIRLNGLISLEWPPEAARIPCGRRAAAAGERRRRRQRQRQRVLACRAACRFGRRT